MKQTIIDSLNSAVNRYYKFFNDKKLDHNKALDAAYDWFLSELEFHDINLNEDNKAQYKLDLEKKVTITDNEDSNILTRKDFIKWYNKTEWENKLPRWDRYKSFKREQLPESVINAIDKKTDDIIGLIGDPRTALKKGDSFDRR